ncbi:NAD(P)/FAD-dependent oxidoreductase [Amycolatopsis sp.]|uniref:NAD(P)/FAD-dependent oxidoreductase n=1 Tax=Amycolatopsis sp. TaxID=37632 RepID=UPI002CD07431|nr:FAD-dependent oxidoreductase [Amycolatopsis sp.]HVV07994.1 FAD-dependent oxidoreductase [Amycolatopsis sp.]
MHPLRSVTVVGGGLAGFTVARQLRANGFDGALRIVDPQGLPYDRPPLSKAYLTGAATLELAPAAWYDDNAIAVITGHVTKLSPGTGGVLLGEGREITSDAVVLATGGSPRALPNTRVLRSRADADALREALRAGGELLIIGAGLIGAEVASSASTVGVPVTIVDPAAVPLVPAVGPELAGYLHAQHAKHGVRVIRGKPARIGGGTADIERHDGTSVRLDAGTVLAAIGLGVDTGLAESAGLPVHDGIEVDPACRTSNPAIYAVGDIARTRLPDGTLLPRGEHWESAMLDGTAAARSLLGLPAVARPPAWFWSDRYGQHVEAAGSMCTPGTTVLRETGPGSRVAFRVDTAGKLVGCAAVDNGRTLRAARRLIAREAVVGVEELRDPAVDLRKLGR